MSPAFPGVSIPSAGIRLGVATSNRLSQPVRLATSRATVSRQAISPCVRVMGCPSEVQIDCEDPARELRHYRLFPDAEVAPTATAEEHRLRLQAGKARPRVQVAAGERHGGAARS